MNVYKTFKSAIDMFGIVGILTNNKSLSGTNITKIHPDANGSCQLNGAKHTNWSEQKAKISSKNTEQIL